MHFSREGSVPNRFVCVGASIARPQTKRQNRGIDASQVVGRSGRTMCAPTGARTKGHSVGAGITRPHDNTAGIVRSGRMISAPTGAGLQHVSFGRL